MGWEREQRGVAIRIPDLDCAVPRGTAEGGFRHEVPMGGEHFALVLVERGDREAAVGRIGRGRRRDSDVEEFDGAVARGDEELV